MQIAGAQTRAWYQNFRLDGEHVLNVKTGLALDVFGGQDKDEQAVIQYRRHNGANQRWQVVYVDTFKEASKGFNKDFGFHINRDFVLVSKYLDDKYVEIDGGANYYMRKLVYPPKRTQTFYFDQKSKRIRSKQWAQYSLAIVSSGNGKWANGNQGQRTRWW